MNKIIKVFFFIFISFIYVKQSYAIENHNMSVNEMLNERRVALVIGNGEYKNIKAIQSPINDAKAMAETLKGLNFEIISGFNLNQKAMKKLISQFGAEIQKGGVGLFYFAGYGIQVKGDNYLIPIDADIHSEIDVDAEAVNTNTVFDNMVYAKNRLNIMILDACRNNPFKDFKTTLKNGLAEINAPKGIFIAYAAAPNEAAGGETGKNGLYTQELIKNIIKSGLPIESVFKETDESVERLSNKKQTPWETYSITGNFYFKITPDMKIPEAASLKTQNIETLSAPSLAKTVSSSSDYTDPKTGMEFIFVHGGCYKMGETFLDRDKIENERYSHEVCVEDFYIGKNEVTQNQWMKITGSKPSYFDECGDKCPVEQVSWNDVQGFITKLNSISDDKYRLPTEAEWEYACRSGGLNETWAGTNDYSILKEYAWHSERWGQTHSVGQKKPNGLGIYDMSGNVWEWTQDWYDPSYYKNSPKDNPKGALSGRQKIMRGGSWLSSTGYTMCSLRFYDTPNQHGSTVGFRLLRTK